MMLPVSGLSSSFTLQSNSVSPQVVSQGSLQEKITSTWNLLDSGSGSSCSGKISAKVIPVDVTESYQMEAIIGLIATYLETPDIKTWDEYSKIFLKPLTLAIIETELANRLTYSEMEREQALSAGFGSDAKSIMLYVLNQLGMTSRDLINLQNDHGISFEHIRDYGSLIKALDAELESLKCLKYALESIENDNKYPPGMLLFGKLQTQCKATQQLGGNGLSILRYCPFRRFTPKPSLRFPERILPDLPLKLPFCPTITTLSLERMTFRLFPDWAKALPNLNKIILYNVSEAELILEAIKSIKTLKTLNIFQSPSPNTFRTGTYLENFPGLETFDATSCELTSIPSLPDSLTSLDLCYNPQIANISEEQEVRLRKLKYFRVGQVDDPEVQKKASRVYLAVQEARLSSSSSSSSSLSIKP